MNNAKLISKWKDPDGKALTFYQYQIMASWKRHNIYEINAWTEETTNV